MHVDEEKLVVAGWCALALLALGQILPWPLAAWPLQRVLQWLGTGVYRPNLEWWVWFAAPVAALGLGARSLWREGRITPAVLVPAFVFFVVWTMLFPTGVKRYLHFGTRWPGFAVSFVGLLAVSLVAVVGLFQTSVVVRPVERPQPPVGRERPVGGPVGGPVGRAGRGPGGGPGARAAAQSRVISKRALPWLQVLPPS